MKLDGSLCGVFLQEKSFLLPVPVSSLITCCKYQVGIYLVPLPVVVDSWNQYQVPLYLSCLPYKTYRYAPTRNRCRHLFYPRHRSPAKEQSVKIWPMMEINRFYKTDDIFFTQYLVPATWSLVRGTF